MSNALKNTFSKVFCEKKCVLLQNGNVRHFCISSKMQLVFFAFAVSVIWWGVFASLFFFGMDENVRQKEQSVLNAAYEYRSLVSELAVYKEKLADLQLNMEENRQLGLSLLKQNDPEIFQKDEKARLFSHQAEALKGEISLIEENFAKLESKRSADYQNLEEITKENKDLAYERDLALAEAVSLRERLKKTEQLVVDIQNAQHAVLSRVASLVDGGVEGLEDNLKSVDSVLTKAGVSVDKLMAKLPKDEKEDSMGGPFIPEGKESLLLKEANAELLAGLHQKIDRWEDLEQLEIMLPLGNPLKEFQRVSGAFGRRTDPFNKKKARHEGIDMVAPMRSPVLATADGKVLRAGPNGAYGKFVEMEHALGFRTRYAHMDEISVKKGQVLKAGEQVGLMGNTGRSTGPHLHYEIRVNKKVLNPYRFIRTTRNEDKGK